MIVQFTIVISSLGAIKVENNNRKEAVLWKVVRKGSQVEVMFELRPLVGQ